MYLKGSFHTLPRWEKRAARTGTVMGKPPSLSGRSSIPAGRKTAAEVRGGEGPHSPTPRTPVAPPRHRGTPQSAVPLASLLDGGAAASTQSSEISPPASQTIPEGKPHGGLITHPGGKHRAAEYKRGSALGFAFPDGPGAPTARLLGCLE